jgi:hypothetical protein
MKKLLFKNCSLTYQDLIGYGLTIAIFSLVLGWVVSVVSFAELAKFWLLSLIPLDGFRRIMQTKN